MSWLFNNLRILHRIPVKRRPLAGSGTTANEAFHSELNRWFRHSSEVYGQTVDLQLRLGVLGKLLTHSSALWSPTLRQMRHQSVLAQRAAALTIPAEEWERHCGELDRGGYSLRRADLKIMTARKKLAFSLREHARRALSQVVRRRPASVCAVSHASSSSGPSKRTAFTLARVGTLTPPELRSRPKRVQLLSKVSPESSEWYSQTQ